MQKAQFQSPSFTPKTVGSESNASFFSGVQSAELVSRSGHFCGGHPGEPFEPFKSNLNLAFSANNLRMPL